jgi:hypothetical protein
MNAKSGEDLPPFDAYFDSSWRAHIWGTPYKNEQVGKTYSCKMILLPYVFILRKMAASLSWQFGCGVSVIFLWD